MIATPVGPLRRARSAALIACIAVLGVMFPAQGQERSRFGIADLQTVAAAADPVRPMPSPNDAMWLSLAFAIDDFRNGVLDPAAVPETKDDEPMTPEQEVAALRSEVAALRSALAEAERAKESLTYRLSLWTMTDISAAEDVIARTGLDADLLLLRLADAQAMPGQGGPFVPLDDPTGDGVRDASLQALDTHIGRWDGLRQLLLQLPLAEPMDEFRTTSRFGERVDPINGRRAFHAGLDFAGPMRSTVRVTAPGIVVHADYKGGYGRLVEVDHGLGITTRYAHLSAILVEVGDEVAYRTPVGLLGSSGRSTGPHLHYEIHVDGEPLDPAPFVDAGRYVFKAQY
jgi:murein DD-endopeptidase MepM/ murein hydrolase activator NlpD